MFRKCIFWIHLAAGVVAGLVILSMSFTGVLLTYERQINRALAERHFVPEMEQSARLSLEELLFIQQQQHGEFTAQSLVIDQNPGAPVSFRAGRFGGVSLNPYTGQEMETGSPRAETFFSNITSFHRWFSIEGEKRNIARQVTGISNLAFLFLALSGLYLWFPAVMKWTLFKARLVFRNVYPNSKARDFHWHHIFGIWMAIPLIAIIYTGSMFYYPWARNLVFTVLGVEQPAAPGQNPGSSINADSALLNEAPDYLSLDELLDKVLEQTDKPWNNMSLTLPRVGQTTLSIVVDWGNGAQAHKQHTLSVDRSTGNILSVNNYDAEPAATKIRSFQRFGHTGELFGFWGQTLAGLASLAGVLMVWTGLALSYRRLIQPLLRKRT